MWLRATYGIDLLSYTRIVEMQCGRCLLCERLTSVLHVDHDHETNEIRGLLCGSCNRGLGLFGESIIALKNAIAYLEQHGKK
jgi:hypothetical protein